MYIITSASVMEVQVSGKYKHDITPGNVTFQGKYGYLIYLCFNDVGNG